MGAREANKLAELAAELREQVPPQFLPQEDATLRPDFALAEGEPPAPPETPEADTQDISFEIAEDTPRIATLVPVASEADEDTDLEVEAEPDLAGPQFNVVDTPGAADIFEQQTDVEAVHEEAEEQLRRRNFQAQDAVADGKDFESSLNGYQVAGPYANAREGESTDKKREKENEKFTQSMLKKILDDRIKWLDAQIAYWGEQERLWQERGDAIAEAIARKDRGEEIEVDADGLPRDRRLREAVDAFEKKYGRRLDVNNKDDLLTLQQFQRDELALARAERERLEREREERMRQKAELEAGGMTPEKRQQIGEQLTTLEGQREIGELAWLARDNRELNQTIDTIAATTEDDRALVEARNAGQSGYAQVDVAAEDDLYGGGTSVAKNADPVESLQQSIAPGFRVAANAEQTPAVEDPSQRVAAVPASTPARSA